MFLVVRPIRTTAVVFPAQHSLSKTIEYQVGILNKYVDRSVETQCRVLTQLDYERIV